MNSKNVLAPYDAVIVLANFMDANGVLNQESAARAELSAAVFNQTKTSHLVTCGWAYRDDSNIKIADAFKRHITSVLGVPSEKIITETKSRDTVGDAYFTSVNLAVPRSWRNICVVTSDYHVERTREIFEFVYGENVSVEVFGVEVPREELTLKNELSSLEAFRNTFMGVQSGNKSQILERLRERHPFYNGAVYDKI